MARSIWKGSISFGLVNIPVSLFSAEERSDIHFRMIDSRNRARIRYERVNEASGEEVPWDAIVKGYEYDDGQYVLITDEEMENARPEATKTIDIEDFIDLDEIDYLYFDKPYYLEPGKSGEKSYALLAESLQSSGKAGIARVVIRSRQHLCAILSRQGRLIINLLRFPQEIRSIEDFKAPDTSVKRNQPSDREVQMAVQLIDSMTVPWDPDRYHDDYREQLLEWINERIASGQIASAPAPGEEEESEPTKVVDLMEYLKKSMEGRGAKGESGAAKSTRPPAAKKGAAKKNARKKAAPKKTASKKAAAKKSAKKAPAKTARRPARKAS